MPENTPITSSRPDLSRLPLFAAPAVPPVREIPSPPVDAGGPLEPAMARPSHSPRPSRPSSPAGSAAGDVDWTLVRALRTQAAERLSSALRDREGTDEASQRELGRSIVQELVTEHVTASIHTAATTATPQEQQYLVQALFDSLFGLGRLQPLVDHPDVENIEINGFDNVVLQYSNGRLAYGPPVADSDEELIEFLQFLASRSQANERPFSPASPELHLRLDDGSRLAANAWITPRPAVVIRLHRLRKVTLDDLVARDLMDEELASLLRAAVRARLSIVVSGAQGAGKTTLLRALCAELDPWERLGTLETEYELHLHELPEQHRRITAWEARPGSGEVGVAGKSAGAVGLDAILYGSFRFNLERFVVGEVRGKEVLAMFKAMQGGAGSMSTTHASNAHGAINRLATLAMEAGPHVSEGFADRQIAEHIDLIVHVTLEYGYDQEPGSPPSRVRFISEVLYVEQGEGGRPATTHVYRSGPDGRAVAGTLPGPLAILSRFGFQGRSFGEGAAA
jgi:pilus assembly protein CpaF